MMKTKNTVMLSAILAGLIILTGCTRSLNTIAPSAPPRALPSAPSESVASNQLPPLDSNQQATQNATLDQRMGITPTPPENQQQVGVANSAETTGSTSSSMKITREGMAGSWQVPTDGLDCRIILAFTKWSGGYRAASRRCTSPEIQNVNAWDVKDQSVVLVDQSGNEVARLFGTNSGRYDGRTLSGQPVSFVR
jgi:hypothetical protein